jgi:hypothetical protein
MRILAFAILAIGTVSIGPTAAQMSEFSGLHARVETGSELLRLQFHDAVPVQRVGIGPRGWV